MSQEIKEVSESVKAIGGLRDKARRIQRKIQEDSDKADKLLDQVEVSVANPLSEVVTELSLILATSTNNPPQDK